MNDACSNGTILDSSLLSFHSFHGYERPGQIRSDGSDWHSLKKGCPICQTTPPLLIRILSFEWCKWFVVILLISTSHGRFRIHCFLVVWRWFAATCCRVCTGERLTYLPKTVNMAVLNWGQIESQMRTNAGRLDTSRAWRPFYIQ
jgi:hypothetical protein